MGLIDLLLNSGGGSLLNQVQQQASTDKRGASELLSTVGSALLGQVKGRIQSDSHDSSNLEGLIKDSKYAQMIDEPDTHLNDNKMRDRGNDLLGYITGSKETSREIASEVAQKTGFSSSIIKSLLPMIAPMIIGSLSKGMLGGSSNSSSQNSSNGLIGMLDFDNDGSVIDDVANLAMRFLR